MPIPVITVAQMREWEKATFSSGVEEDAVMRRAGQAVSRLIERITKPDDAVLFLAGKGHNGDDAVYAAEYLSGRRAATLRVVDPARAAKELAARLAERPALVVDGLFGIGLNRPLSGDWMRLIDQLNRSGARVLAVDVPSGLSADSGLPLEVAVRADCTLTLGAAKQGLVKMSAAPFVGRLEIAPDIGLLNYPFTTELSLTEARDFEGYPPRRAVTGHKGTYGHLTILAGSPGYHGAAVLAARGAQRAQPGLITLTTHPDVYVPVAGQLQSVMVNAFLDEPVLADSCSAVLIGPGLAARDLPAQLSRVVRKIWQDSPLPVIVDASALDWLAAGSCRESALRVITPHPGEAARLLGATVAEVQRDRPEAVRHLSRRWGGCQVVLKGHQTIVGQGQGDLSLNSSGNPYLAQGGSGDVLAGYLGGLLAQPALQQDPGKALRFGVWQHGAAADWLRASRGVFTVEDLAASLGSVCAEG